ncbi:MAG: S-adenosylmethionine decarboxylase [Ignavibacteriales bacterium]|nr:S-adenosylmethionine decarboxylase [Ignavibacteriales bacterium]
MNTDDYGMELIMDLIQCEVQNITKRQIRTYINKSCEIAKTKKVGSTKYWIDNSRIPHLNGISAIQFIETSTIVIHVLPLLRTIYINYFSCKEFDAKNLLNFSINYFNAKHYYHQIIERKIR